MARERWRKGRCPKCGADHFVLRATTRMRCGCGGSVPIFIPKHHRKPTRKRGPGG